MTDKGASVDESRYTKLSVLPLLCCLVSSLVTLLIVEAVWRFGPFHMYGAAAWHLVVTAILVPLIAVALLIVSSHRLGLAVGLQFLFLLLAALTIANVTWRLVELAAYGDAGSLSETLEKGRVFPRWFLGSALLTNLYLYLSPLLETLLPETLSSADGFVRGAGVCLMVAVSLSLLRFHGRRLAVLLPLSTPVWIMFCTGYDEYYPFIAGGLLGFLFVVRSRLSERSPMFIAVVASIVSLVYVAFVPLAFILLTYYGWLVGFRKMLKACVVAALICTLAIVILWPDTMAAFASESHNALNLGEKNTGFRPYMGQAAGGVTPFFAVSYALSFEHLTHLSFMFFFGAGLIVPLVFVLGAIHILRKDRWYQLVRATGMLGVGACLAFELFYFVFMIPKLGPIRDIDLFFSVYIMVAFAAGCLADQALASLPEERRSKWYMSIVGASLGSSCCILFYMLGVGFLPS